MSKTDISLNSTGGTVNPTGVATVVPRGDHKISVCCNSVVSLVVVEEGPLSTT